VRVWRRPPDAVDAGRRQVRHGVAAGSGGRPVARRTSGRPAGLLAGRGDRGRGGGGGGQRCDAATADRGRRDVRSSSAGRRGGAGLAVRNTRRVEALPVQRRWVR